MMWLPLFAIFLASSSASDFNFTDLLQTEYGVEWSPFQALCNDSCQPADCQWSSSPFAPQPFIMSLECVCHVDCLWSGTCCLNFEEVCFPVFSKQNISHPGLRKYMQEKAQITDELHNIVRLRNQQRLFECAPIMTEHSTHSEVLIRCPSFTTASRDIVELCENNKNQLMNQLIPVLYNGRAYRNIYCVQCYNISLDQLSPSDVPPIDIQCTQGYFAEREDGTYSEVSMLKALQRGQCQLIYHVRFSSVACVPKGRNNCDRLPSGLEPAKGHILSACRSFQEQFEVNHKFYVNIFCAICHENSININPDCPLALIIRKPDTDLWKVTTFSILLDFSTLISQVDLTATRICDFELEFLRIHDNKCVARQCPHEYYLLDNITCAHMESASFDQLHDNTTLQSVFLCITCSPAEDSVSPDLLMGALTNILSYTPIQEVMFDDYFPCNHNYDDLESSHVTQGYQIVMDESLGFDSTLIYYALNTSLSAFINYFHQEILQISIHDSQHLNESFLISPSPQLVFSQPIYASLNNLDSHSLNMTILLPNLYLTLSREYVLLSAIFVLNPNTAEWEAEWKAHFNATQDVSCDEASSRCVAVFSHQPRSPFLQRAEEILTLVLNALSITSLFSSQVASMFSRLPNQPINLLYDILRVSLMVAHLLFILTGVPIGSSLACTLIAALQHLAWLISFFTMSSLAFKLYKVFVNMRSISVPSAYLAPGYLVHAFCGPLCIVAICGAGHALGWFLYGQPGACWIVGGLNVFLAFALPVFVLLISNAVLCAIIVFYLRKSMAQSAQVTNFFSLQMKLKIYGRVIAVMGLSWLSGILINIWSSEYLRILFTLLACSNGIFVSLCFAAKSRQSSP